MKKLKIIIPVVLILAGTAVIITLLTGENATESGFPEDFFKEGSNVEWLGIYLKGHKVGYMASKIDTTDEGYTVYSNTYMKMAPTAGFEREVSYRVVANTDRSYNLRDFYFRMLSGEHIFEAEGRRKGDKLYVEMDLGGEKRKNEYQLESSYIPATLEGLVKIGKTGEFEFFDPTLQSVFKINVRKLGSDTIDGIPAEKYSVSQSGINMYFWISRDGSLIREESPIGLVMKKESADVVTDIETAGFKLFDSYAIKPDRVINNPRGLNLLTIRLDSVDISGLRIEDDRQKLNGNVLTVRTVEPGVSTNVPQDMDEFMRADAFIPSDNEKIINLAREVTDGSRGWDAVKSIVIYVDTLLRDKPTFSIPNALDAIKSREGDCNEHSALAVALLRAAGIPSRVEVGIVYVAGAFYYHAWVSSFVGGKWVASDPTFGQYIADAAHVKLEYGGFEEQAKLYRVINKLQIKVLEYD